MTFDLDTYVDTIIDLMDMQAEIMPEKVDEGEVEFEVLEEKE